MPHDTAADLTAITAAWPDLRDALTTPPPATWPPTSLADYLSHLSDVERDEHAAETRAERADRTATAPGERPVPLRLGILDTITVVDVKLIHAADVIAADVQGPFVPDDHPGRWRYNLARRDGLTAARWLLQRITEPGWPFRPLTEAHRQLIGPAAAEARALVEQALGLDRQDTAERPCPHCGGPIRLRQGDEPSAACGGQCGGVWAGPELAYLYADMERRVA